MYAMMRREKQDCQWQNNFEDTYNKKEIWDNKHALSTFPSTPVKTGKAPTRLSNSRVQFNWAAIILATWLDTPLVADVALFSYRMSSSGIQNTSTCDREQPRRGCAAYPLTTLRK